MSEKLAEAEALINGANDSLVAKLNAQAPRGTPTVSVKGRFPLWNIRLKAPSESEGEDYPADWALKMHPTGRFTDGRVEVDGAVYEPYIDNVLISDGGQLLLNSAGGFVFCKIDHTMAATYSGSHIITIGNVVVSLVNVALGAAWPAPTHAYISASPVSTGANAGTCYVFLLEYDSTFNIVTYGGNRIISTDSPSFDITVDPVTYGYPTYRVVA